MNPSAKRGFSIGRLERSVGIKDSSCRDSLGR